MVTLKRRITEKRANSILINVWTIHRLQRSFNFWVLPIKYSPTNKAVPNMIEMVKEKRLLLIDLSSILILLSFFAVMFGSVLVEPYIGKLWIATTADSVLKDALDNNNMSKEELDSETLEAAAQT